MRENPKRKFIRHTVDVPIEVRTVDGEHLEQSVNVSSGGLAFTTDVCFPAGDVIELRIPTVDPPFEARARVAWCEPEEEKFLVGVEFLEASDAFRSRMVQQVCSIENYRREVREREGRFLDQREAAAEWIANYANRFPDSEQAS